MSIRRDISTVSQYKSNPERVRFSLNLNLYAFMWGYEKESFHKLFTTVGAETVLVPLFNTLHHIGEIFQAPFLTVRCRNLQ